MKNMANPFERSPTLTTVQMVEKTIGNFSGEFNKTQLWKKLPKKVMWQTYLVVLDYLQEINKIAVDGGGKIGYIWNPALAKKLRERLMHDKSVQGCVHLQRTGGSVSLSSRE